MSNIIQFKSIDAPLNQGSYSNRKTFFKYQSTMSRGMFTEQEIISLRKQCGSSSTLPTIMRHELLRKFYAIMPLEGYWITSEQSEKGIEWLRNYAFKKNGELRNSKRMVFGEREAEIIRDFKEFKFVGLHLTGNNYWEAYLPIYRVISNSGKSFDYSTNMGLIEVLN